MTRFRIRYPLMMLGVLTLLIALVGGLARMGWHRTSEPVALLHGPVMIAGFFGTVIALERAVAVGTPWAYASPLLNVLGALWLLAGGTEFVGVGLLLLGSLGLFAIFGVVLRRQFALFTVTMTLGAMSLVVSNVVWLAGWPFVHIVPWWMAFLGLTIAGERLELSRVRHPSSTARWTFAAATVLVLAGLVMTTVRLDLAARVVGAGYVAWMLWFARYDVAIHTVRQRGLPRFIASCLLSGYFWLGLSGTLWLVLGGNLPVLHRDAVMHAFFLGFVFSMIFGHAPIILPSVLGVPVTFQRSFYAPLILLHLSLVLRIAGDLALWTPGWRWGGLLNALVILLFLANTARSALRARASASAPNVA